VGRWAKVNRIPWAAKVGVAKQSRSPAWFPVRLFWHFKGRLKVWVTRGLMEPVHIFPITPYTQLGYMHSAPSILCWPLQNSGLT
jgi:hypothetical protein